MAYAAMQQSAASFVDASVIPAATLYDTASRVTDIFYCSASCCVGDLARVRPVAQRGRALSESIVITSQLGKDQRGSLEQLLFFNINQHRVRLGIQQSIETYGVPEIYEQEGWLRIRVGDIDGVQTLFAVSARGRPVGVAVFVRLPHERFLVLHLGVEPRAGAAADVNRPVLLKLMHAIRSTALRTQHAHIELVYKERPAARSNA
jgi:hypothetical protein